MARLGLLFLFLLLCSLKALPVYAQDNATLDGYVPPPMFGAQRAIPPKKAQPKTPKMPAISRPVAQEPLKEPPKTVKPKSVLATAPKAINETPKKKPVTVKQVTKPKVAPAALPPIVVLETIVTPTSKPEPVIQAPVIQQAPVIEKIDVMPQLEPIDLIRQEKAQPKPVPKPKQSSGIVKGPKTMPAVKKQGVETEVLFEPKIKPAISFLDREKKQEEVESVLVEETPPQNYTAPKFSILPDGSRKLNLIFSEIQAELSAEQKYALNQLIIPLLQENSKPRLRLEAYASPRDGSLSGDRRIALSRAMAIRKHIVDQNIAASRLDVRSLGAQTDVVPMDRVEIFIVNR